MVRVTTDSAFTDPAFAATTFVVIDFEGLTPAGRPPVPIEVAAIAGTLARDGSFERAWEFQELMRPPDDVPVTSFDTRQTGISATMLADAAPAATVMAALDARLAHPPYRLVAHSAGTEATMIGGQREHCPTLAATSLLCTVKLGRLAVPELNSHRLDALARYFSLPIPPDRHRAMPDVALTVRLFGCLVATGRWNSLLEMDKDGGVYVRRPAAEGEHGTQDSLF